jgi:cytochrome c-type biogenesis protein CcmF
VALAFAIFFLSFFTRISHDFLGRKLSVGIPHYNLVATPLFAILILLKGIGPLIGWVKASGANLRRNFLGPGIVGLGTMAAAFAFSRRSLVPDLYPVSLLMGLSTFVVATIWVEFRRGLRTRMRHHGEGPGSALVSLFVLNNRRYGGYLVHLGFVVIVFGVVASAFFRSKEDLNLEPDSPGQVGRYTVTVDPFDPARDFTPEGPGRPYAREVARFRIADASGNVVADLRPERHFYQKQQINVSTPAISRNFINDYYVHFSGRDRGKVVFEIFVNPFVNWIWAGWLILIAGSLVAILPMPVRRIGLAE